MRKITITDGYGNTTDVDYPYWWLQSNIVVFLCRYFYWAYALETAWESLTAPALGCHGGTLYQRHPAWFPSTHADPGPHRVGKLKR